MQPLEFVIVDETGRELAPGVIVQDDLLELFQNESFACVKFIDPYGDTVFNYLQVPVVLNELDVVLRSSPSQVHQAQLRALIELFKRLLNERHMYVKVIGN